MSKSNPFSNSKNIFKIANWATLVVFITFSIYWMVDVYLYSGIKFLEELQLFRTGSEYFNEFISKPSGLSNYISSFVTQFYATPYVGVIILAVTYIFTYLLFVLVCKKRGNVFRFFSFYFIVPIAMLYIYNSDNSMYVTYANFFGIIYSLASLLLYQKLYDKYKIIGGVTLYLLAYYITGGNALLFVCLVLLYELFEPKKNYIVVGLLIALTALLPFLSYKLVYVTTLKEAYLSTTPFVLVYSNIFYTIAWILTPVAYLLCLITSKYYKPSNSKTVAVVLTIINIAIVAGFCWYGVKQCTYTKKEMEHVMHIAYETEQGNWDKVIELGEAVQPNKTTQFRNAVPIAYFMNIALCEKGRFANEMFRYRQTGTYGLYVSWAIHHTTDIYIGELYYRMGVAAIAEQCAFEAMVTSTREHSSKTIRRLVQTHMMRKDVDGFEKYIRLLEKSPIYKGWAKEQRKHFEASLKDDKYVVPNLPKMAKYDNFFFSSGSQEQNFAALLNFDAKNRKAFEYMAASLLLSKDLLSFESFMEAYYPQQNYTKLPLAFEEAIIILAFNNKPELLSKYNVSKQSVERFNNLNSDINRATTKVAQQKLREKYQNTYWIYYQFVKPMDLQDIPSMMVY
ncbi:hypothetical protein M2138_002133 [Dysgonomonadaceae bacterium PH5-43]|nr:hypothetical protein [Dysgonomonadaceae bacterium PH5-43]